MLYPQSVSLQITITGGFSEEQSCNPHINALFHEAKLLHESFDAHALSIIANLLRCHLLLSNLDGDISELFDIDRNIESDVIVVTHLYYSDADSIIPKVTMNATFNVQAIDGFNVRMLHEWHRGNSRLEEAFAFSWYSEDEDGELMSSDSDLSLTFVVAA